MGEFYVVWQHGDIMFMDTDGILYVACSISRCGPTLFHSRSQARAAILRTNRHVAAIPELNWQTDGYCIRKVTAR